MVSGATLCVFVNMWPHNYGHNVVWAFTKPTNRNLYSISSVWWVSLSPSMALDQLIFRLSLFLSVISELLSLHCATSLCRFSLSFFFLSLEMNWTDYISFSFIITGLKDTRSASFRAPPQFLLLLSAQSVFYLTWTWKFIFNPSLGKPIRQNNYQWVLNISRVSSREQIH